MTLNELNALEEAANKATPGNWSSDSCGDVWTDAEKEYCPGMEQNIFRTIGTTRCGPDRGDAKWIAAANPAAILSLIAAHRDLEAKLKIAREALEHYACCHYCRACGQPDQGTLASDALAEIDKE